MFRNLSANDAAFFTINGDFDLTALAQISGDTASAGSTVSMFLDFSIEGPLNISFAPLLPFQSSEFTSGPGAAASFGRSTDPASTRRVGLSVFASAFGSQPSAATVGLSDTFVLGVTLQPTQVLTMNFVISP